MGEPIILDGGDQMIRIKLPSSFERPTPDTEKTAEGNFSVFSVTRKDTEPFQSIVIMDKETGVRLSTQLLPAKPWIIEIK